MIPYSKYCEQLRELYDSKLLQSHRLVNIVRYLDDSILLHAAVPASSTDLSHLELKITYTHVYQEPLLLIKVWQREHPGNEYIDLVSPCYPQDIRALLGIDKSFQVELDAVISPKTHTQETWYSIHPCDTAEIVGGQAQFLDGYLKRWISVFLLSWVVER